jgi:hypothetical protein
MCKADLNRFLSKGVYIRDNPIVNFSFYNHLWNLYGDETEVNLGQIRVSVQLGNQCDKQNVDQVQAQWLGAWTEIIQTGWTTVLENLGGNFDVILWHKLGVVVWNFLGNF